MQQIGPGSALRDVGSAEFAAFVRERERPLLRFAMVLCGDARRAEELVADALARAYERWSRISELDQPTAYVRRMIVNDYLTWRRHLRRTVPVADPDRGAAPDHAVEHAERAELIAALAALPPKQRAVLVLRFYLDLPDEEIAATLDCSPSTVRSNAARALAALRIPFAHQPPAREEV
jgi:RNA polymerase sigma-70 factor (sigma-E family)